MYLLFPVKVTEWDCPSRFAVKLVKVSALTEVEKTLNDIIIREKKTFSINENSLNLVFLTRFKYSLLNKNIIYYSEILENKLKLNSAARRWVICNG